MTHVDPCDPGSDVSVVTLRWETGRPAMMEKPPLRSSCFHSLSGNCAQFKEAPSLRSPIVSNGSWPRATLPFPLFQLQLYQTWSDRTGWPAPWSPSCYPLSHTHLYPLSNFLISEIPFFFCASVTGIMALFWLQTCSVYLRMTYICKYSHVVFPKKLVE